MQAPPLVGVPGLYRGPTRPPVGRKFSCAKHKDSCGGEPVGGPLTPCAYAPVGVWCVAQMSGQLIGRVV